MEVPVLMESAITYSNASKIRVCGVKPETLAAYGAVSRETSAELAAGMRARAGTDIGLSVTGIAGHFPLSFLRAGHFHCRALTEHHSFGIHRVGKLAHLCRRRPGAFDKLPVWVEEYFDA